MHKRTLTRIAAPIVLAASTLLTMAPVAHAKLSAEQSCQKSRYDAAAAYAQCQNKALGQIFVTNDLAKLQPALSKCRVKYTGTYLKIQKKAVGTGSTCDAPRFVATGNGTVLDNLTALEWEQKTDDGTVHDKDTAYAWFFAYDIFLANDGGLNDVQSGCFGSLCNWRLPTVTELQTLLSEPFPCTTSPCIAPIFGPTAAGDYWSSTTLADNTDYAWRVFFDTGEVSYTTKVTSHAVRGVRGGL